MKVIVTLYTWKPSTNPGKFNSFEEDIKTRFLFEADNLNEAELKVLESFPADQTIGFNIKMENGDFSCHCCKDYWFYGGANPTDEQIKRMQILQVLTAMKNEEDVKAGRKQWVEDPYTGDMILKEVC